MENSKLSIIEKIKTFYYYLFYTLYKWYENSYFNWWSEWKAGISLDIIIFFALFPLFLYYNIYVDRSLRIENYIIHIKFIFIIFIAPFFVYIIKKMYYNFYHNLYNELFLYFIIILIQNIVITFL